MKPRSSLITGLIGSIALTVFYFAVVTIAESFKHAASQFASYWPFLAVLVAGFGAQLGLYTLMRSLTKQKGKGAGAEVAATGGVSATAMVACCAHHVVDLLPILGLSVAAVFLTEFQVSFMVLGIVSNLIGISLMLYIMQKHRLTPPVRFFQRLMSLNLKRAVTAVSGASVIAVVLTFVLAAGNARADDRSPAVPELYPVSSDDSAVGFTVKPVDFAFGEPAVFEISMNTHSVNLDFDLTEISVLRLNDDVFLEPVEWSGSTPGGHHRSGRLVFPPITEEARYMFLIVRGVAGVPERVFSWQLTGAR